jgi:WD40 repeat protein
MRHNRATATGRKRTSTLIRPESWMEVARGGEVIQYHPNGSSQVIDMGTDLVTGLAIEPGVTWLATAYRDGSVRIWDPASGRERAILTGHTRPVDELAVAPDGAWLATASDDGSVRIWDPATGRERAILTGHTGPVTGLTVAPDGTWLATASQDRSVRIWDPATGCERAALTGHTGAVTAVAVTADGAWLAATGRDGSVRIWDPATNAVRAIMRADLPLRACTWSPSGQSLAIAGDAGLYLFTFKPYRLIE